MNTETNTTVAEVAVAAVSAAAVSVTEVTLRLKFSNPYFVDAMSRVDSFPEITAKVMKEVGNEKYTRIGKAVAEALYNDMVICGWDPNEMDKNTARKYAARATSRTFSTTFGFDLPVEKPKAVKVVVAKEPKAPKAPKEPKVPKEPKATSVDVSKVPAPPSSESVQKLAASVIEVLGESVDEATDTAKENVETMLQSSFDKTLTGVKPSTNIFHERNAEDTGMTTYRGTRADGSKVKYKTKFDDGTVEFYNAAGNLHDPFTGKAARTYADGQTEHYKNGVMVAK
jgi:uncharacterized protein YqgV (UPF0045/DUF77 family)